MLYWFTGNITSSFWLYYLRRSGDGQESKLLETTKIHQPVAFGCGNYEIHWPVRKVFEMQLSDIRSWTVLQKGGHFLAAVRSLTSKDNRMLTREAYRKHQRSWRPT
jgi:microsomal epoxide hydrolase